jgi:Spy/CpxP family protein refolding chaperone
MNITTKSFKFTLAAIMGSLISFGAMAGPGHNEGRLAKALDLTDAQVTQLKSMREANKATRKQGHEAMKALMEKKQALLTNYDAQAANTIATEEAAMHKARVLKKLEHQQAIYAILDDEQKKKFAEMLAKPPKGKDKRKHKDGDRKCDD